jgi:hypothetical protein
MRHLLAAVGEVLQQASDVRTSVELTAGDSRMIRVKNHLPDMSKKSDF